MEKIMPEDEYSEFKEVWVIQPFLFICQNSFCWLVETDLIKLVNIIKYSGISVSLQMYGNSISKTVIC